MCKEELKAMQEEVKGRTLDLGAAKPPQVNTEICDKTTKMILAAFNDMLH